MPDVTMAPPFTRSLLVVYNLRGCGMFLRPLKVQKQPCLFILLFIHEYLSILWLLCLIVLFQIYILVYVRAKSQVN